MEFYGEGFDRWRGECDPDLQKSFSRVGNSDLVIPGVRRSMIQPKLQTHNLLCSILKRWVASILGPETNHGVHHVKL